MRPTVRLAAAAAIALTLGGCVALGALVTAYDVTASAVGIGQRNQAQDTAEENLEELRGLRSDMRKSGLAKHDSVSASEAARDRKFERPERTLWERIKRMTP